MGIPDRSAGEYKHGFERVQNESFHIEQYRVYWGAYNFTQDFPNGVDFTIGKNDLVKDWVRPDSLVILCLVDSL